MLISGAEIAGPTLAYWLDHFGFETTIVEEAPGLVQAIYIHSAKAKLPDYSYVDRFLYSQSIEEIKSRPDLPPPIGNIRFECGALRSRLEKLRGGRSSRGIFLRSTGHTGR